MKFIHLADAHLDSPFRGLSFLPSETFDKIYQAADQSFTKIVDTALEEKVDLVLIAGDTFDSNKPSPRSQVFFAEQIKRLTDAEIQVVMIFGNHDHMKPEDLLVEPSSFFKLLGANEEVESADFKTKDGFKYQVNGFSYLNNHISEDKLPEFPKKGPKFTFGLMHGQVQTTEASQNVYAPFTVREMTDLNYDYFALGHIHLRQNLSADPLIVYSGNIQGRHKNEQGAKGCYLGEIDEVTLKTQLTFKKTSPIIWDEDKLTIHGPLSKSDLQDAIIKSFDAEEMIFYDLQIEGGQFLTEEQIELLNDSDYRQGISSRLAHSSQWISTRIQTGTDVLINTKDTAILEQAIKEIFRAEEASQIIKDWIKKDPVNQKIFDSDDFLENIKEMVRVKLALELKEAKDEAKEN